ncbi:hypothetical protein [Pantanalinema sp. GBBB05]|uniref:hypothetical protein n=1 Tax=Pantanalinema sp. GBBB05 TaxID=2604139 RepID=UPI001D96F7EE|nr:hypothetical protein [Pantanalinema sp. GBBB05]
MSAVTTVWQFGSNAPDNTDNLATIRQWWAGLDGQRINWRQRVLPGTVAANTLNWEPQRFDETFIVTDPELRGITLYWKKPDSPQEKSTTPDRLELDHVRQQLYIFPRSQKELVIRIERPDLVYQTVTVQANQSEYAADTQVLTVRDDLQRLEVKVKLSPELVQQLKQQL